MEAAECTLRSLCNSLQDGTHFSTINAAGFITDLMQLKAFSSVLS
jgi:hypothetical protein